MCKILTSAVCVNLAVLHKLCEKSRCFPGKFTQLAQILHDCRSSHSQQISTLDGCDDDGDGDYDDNGDFGQGNNEEVSMMKISGGDLFEKRAKGWVRHSAWSFSVGRRLV